jgi:hypothetical protein
MHTIEIGRMENSNENRQSVTVTAHESQQAAKKRITHGSLDFSQGFHRKVALQGIQVGQQRTSTAHPNQHQTIIKVVEDIIAPPKSSHINRRHYVHVSIKESPNKDEKQAQGYQYKESQTISKEMLQ